ncbi:MAG: hypothetical protein EAY81_03815 [Bacteroidetes bacterium]|nr:MAG: hypothetical protein EAY81_03815 [Bacteroidota bacterium]
MIRLTTIALALICVSASIQGQVITIQSGLALSKLDWKANSGNIRLYDNYRQSTPVFIGVDYFNKKYFNLSSNVGYVEKGGEVAGIQVNGSDFKIETWVRYISLNTCGNVKYQLDKRLTIFANIGPRIDFLIDSDNSFFKVYQKSNGLNKINVGLTYGAGIKYRINKTIVGFSTNSNYNFNQIVDLSGSGNRITINDQTLLLLFSIGYEI